ncbi:MAG: hypothetical protein ACK2TT_01645 [Anaerolineales bacterium]
MVEKKKQPAGSNFWQVIFPTSLGAVLVILIGAWFVFYSSSGNVSRFAEISTVLLVIPVYIIALVVGLVLVGLIYLVTRIMGWIPGAADPILKALDKIRQGASLLSKTSARVVIEPASWAAGIRRKKPPTDREIKLSD